MIMSNIFCIYKQTLTDHNPVMQTYNVAPQSDTGTGNKIYYLEVVKED